MDLLEVLGTFRDDTLGACRHHQCRRELRTTRLKRTQVVRDGLCQKKVIPA